MSVVKFILSVRAGLDRQIYFELVAEEIIEREERR